MKCSEVGCNAKVQLREQIKKSIKSYNNALSKSTSDRDESITDYEYENRIRAVFDE
jgi:invasion protein IalB